MATCPKRGTKGEPCLWVQLVGSEYHLQLCLSSQPPGAHKTILNPQCSENQKNEQSHKTQYSTASTVSSIVLTEITREQGHMATSDTTSVKLFSPGDWFPPK